MRTLCAGAAGPSAVRRAGGGRCAEDNTGRADGDKGVAGCRFVRCNNMNAHGGRTDACCRAVRCTNMHVRMA
jgi:hypothetical protein